MRGVSRGRMRADRARSHGARVAAAAHAFANIDGRGGAGDRPTGGRAHPQPSSGERNLQAVLAGPLRFWRLILFLAAALPGAEKPAPRKIHSMVAMRDGVR